MVDVKIVVVSVIAVLSVSLQSGSRAQPTISSSSEYDSCSQLKEEHEFQVVQDMRLRSVLESKLQKIEELENELLLLRRLRSRELGLQSVAATFISSFGSTEYHGGITKVEDKIYILNHRPSSIKVYEDAIGFPFMTDIALSGIVYPDDIVYSNASKCVYIGDGHNWDTGVWVMTTTVEHEQKKLFNATRPCTLSFTQEGHLLVPRNEIFSQNSLEIFSLNGTLIRRFNLLEDVKDPRHVVQTSDGKFILLHRLNTSRGPWVISQLTNDGQLINRFIPRNKSEELLPEHLCLDSDNNRLFVADSWNHRVILFDSRDLTWSQVLLSQGKNDEKFQPYRLFYDASKKRLFVEPHKGNVAVYEIN